MSYKNLFVFILFFTFSTTVFAVDVSVKAENNTKLKLKLIVVGKQSSRFKDVVSVIKNDLEFSGQFDVVLSQCQNSVERKSDIIKYFEDDCRLGVFLTEERRRKSFGWRLYDLEYAQMLKGQVYKIVGKDLHGWGHAISDSLWPNLTGEKGFFSTKIVYCKKVELPGKKSLKHIYVADYDGSNEKLLVSTPTINVAPRWNNDPKRPLIFYSEHTNKNVRLMVVDMKGRRKVASNFDGLNILSAFSPDGKRFAYCASRGDGACQIYFYDGELKRLTQNGNNISPTFADNGNTLYFCSDAYTKNPQIYSYDLKTKKTRRISKSGFEVSTTFCPTKNLLAYSKMVRGTMQIFTYNPSDNSHKQITFGRGNKEECSWSPCGNYILFSVEKNNKSRLATMNLLTGNMKYITGAHDSCYYPNWAPVYNNFPCVIV